jgi:hypothetical protein
MTLYPFFLLICSQCPVSFVAGMFQTDGQKLPGTMCDHQFISSNYSLTHGRFYSPRYPSSYPKNIKCAYRFRGRSARFSTIEITHVHHLICTIVTVCEMCPVILGGRISCVALKREDTFCT